MDPFLEDVIQQQYKDIAREGQKQQLQARASAVGAAFLVDQDKVFYKVNSQEIQESNKQELVHS